MYIYIPLNRNIILDNKISIIKTLSLLLDWANNKHISFYCDENGLPWQINGKMHIPHGKSWEIDFVDK